MAEPRNFDIDYYTVKMWREKTMPKFIRLKALVQLRTGEHLNNVELLHMLVEDGLRREEAGEKLQGS